MPQATIDQNIESVAALQRREWETTSVSQRRVERLSAFIGRPGYLVAIVTVTLLWVAWNTALHAGGAQAWDAPPFELLDGLLTFVSLLTTAIVLIAQNRQTKLEQQHTHLGLQINLLTEQKVTKLIHLIEELRRDLPSVRDRHDPQASAMQKQTDASEVISAIEEGGLTRGLDDAPNAR